MKSITKISILMFVSSIFFPTPAADLTGLSFSYNGSMQTQLFKCFKSYQLMPGIGITYGRTVRHYFAIIDNNFVLKKIGSKAPFLGIGIQGNFDRHINESFGYNDTVSNRSYYVEPNFGLQYIVNDNIIIYGDVRLLVSYNKEGFYSSFGNTVIGIILCRKGKSEH
jgi:hypothetical protein